jgi:hypothetical protein
MFEPDEGEIDEIVSQNVIAYRRELVGAVP